MGRELLYVLALMGDGTVTLIAFAALFLYGCRLVAVSNRGISRFAALLIVVSSAAWLLLVVAGYLQTGLARWSPVAVMLLAISLEKRGVSDPSSTSAERDSGSFGSSDHFATNGGVPRGNAGSDDLRRSTDGIPTPLRVNAMSGLVRPDTAPLATEPASAEGSSKLSRDSRQATANYRSTP